MILSDKQKEFVKNANHRYNFKIGARRCGKTYLDNLWTIPKRIIERKGKDGLYCIFGVTNGTIERNVLQPLRQIYGKKMVGTIQSGTNIAKLFVKQRMIVLLMSNIVAASQVFLPYFVVYS